MDMKKLALAVVFGAVAVAPALAQAPASERFDTRWNPWLGCWRLLQENAREYNLPVTSGMMVCVQPSGSSGVTMTTTVEGKTILEQKIVADGTPQPVKDADCQGLQTSEWSRDGERLFTRVELQCSGRPNQTISGITLLAKGAWVDVQAIRDVDGDQDIRIRRYQRTSDQYGSVSRYVVSPMSVEDVIEASSKISSAALEAAVDETGGRFNLDSRTLTQLADAGVSPNVIDLMVAQSFPDRFRVERRDSYPPPLTSTTSASTGSSNTTVIFGSSPYGYPYYDPFYYNYYYYSPFAYPYYWGSGYRYNRYNRYNYYNFYGTPRGAIVVPGDSGIGIAQPGTGTAQPSNGSASGSGQMIRGRGYTRVQPNSGSAETEQAPSQSTPTVVRGVRGVRSSSGSGDSGSSSSGSSSSSSGSSGGSISGSSGSSSSGSSGGGGGRTAQPR